MGCETYVYVQFVVGCLEQSRASLQFPAAVPFNLSCIPVGNPGSASLLRAPSCPFQVLLVSVHRVHHCYWSWRFELFHLLRKVTASGTQPFDVRIGQVRQLLS
jgi:hypothetical protein